MPPRPSAAASAPAHLRPPKPLRLIDVFRGGPTAAPDVAALQAGLVAQRPVDPELWRALTHGGAEALRLEPNVVRPKGRVVVVGPVRGQFYDLLNILNSADPAPGAAPAAEPAAAAPTAEAPFTPCAAVARTVSLRRGTRWLFLGDMIDGGPFSSQVLLFLLALKLAHPEQIYLLRGRRETVAKEWDKKGHSCLLRTELRQRYDPKRVPGADPSAMWADCGSVFCALPLAALVAGRYWCASGGIGPTVNTPEDVNAADRGDDTARASGAPQDAVWADPMDDEDEELQSNALFLHNFEKGMSYYYSFNAAVSFLKDNRLTAIIRGVSFPDSREVPPQVTRQTHNSSGRPWHYQYSPYDPGFRRYRINPLTSFPAVMSVFSAPAFLGENENRGAALVIDGDLIDVRQFSAVPAPFALPQLQHAFDWSLPFVAERSAALASALWRTVDARESDPLTQLTEKVRRGEQYDKKQWSLLAFQRMYKLMKRRERERCHTVMYNGLAGLCYALRSDDLSGAAADGDADEPQRRSYYNVSDFARLGCLVDNWQVIREEAMGAWKKLDIVPVHGGLARGADACGGDDVTAHAGWVPSYQHQTGRNPRWLNFGLIHPHGDFDANAAACPRTVALLRGVSKQARVRCGGFSLLQPQSDVKPHRDRTGVADGCLCFHLGVVIPSPQSCTLLVGGRPETHANGKGIVFDAGLLHSAANNHPDEERVVLYVDFELAAGEPKTPGDT